MASFRRLITIWLRCSGASQHPHWPAFIWLFFIECLMFPHPLFTWYTSCAALIHEPKWAKDMKNSLPLYHTRFNESVRWKCSFLIYTWWTAIHHCWALWWMAVVFVLASESRPLIEMSHCFEFCIHECGSSELCTFSSCLFNIWFGLEAWGARREAAVPWLAGGILENPGKACGFYFPVLLRRDFKKQWGGDYTAQPLLKRWRWGE